MRGETRTPKRTRRSAASHRVSLGLIDGARHWPRTLDQFIWLLLRAGITREQLAKALSSSLRKHRKTRALAMPSPQVLEYGRVLTFWQHEPAYLDERGRPRPLNLTGRGASFASLVRQSVPHTHPSDVRAVLSGHGLVSTGRKGQV
jgi:hypothetical protein